MKPSSMNISISISLVRKELESTLQKAEAYFTQYAEDRGEPQLKLFADELNLARGTFKLLELAGPESLTAEMLSLVGDSIPKFEVKLEALGQAIISLNRYIAILLEKQYDQPILLVPVINVVRKAGGHKPINESHFFTVNLRPKLPEMQKAAFDIRPQMGRLRLMYQLGLIRVLRSRQQTGELKLLQRAIDKLEAGLRGTPAWSFWWVAKAAVAVMIEERYELTLARRMMFGKIDLLMRSMIRDGLSIFTKSDANEVLKDLLQLVVLSEVSIAPVKQVKSTYNLSSPITEKMMADDREGMKGPDIGAFESLSKAFQDEINGIKESLDLAAKGSLQIEGYDRMQGQLSRLADVLMVVRHEDLSSHISSQKERMNGVSSLPDSERVEVLASIADSLLQVELATKRFSNSDENSLLDSEVVGAGHYSEAKIVLFEEVENGLALAKRAIASFAETSDKLHLANVKQTLDGLRGALTFLDQHVACKVVIAAIKFLNTRVLSSDELPEAAKLEALADALTSVEYYIETLSKSNRASKDILDLAIQSVAVLGYRVS